ncbi:MAG: flagellar assembly protein FliH [Azoarcus sp.]|jgi:flagellar assembly protein FliH|nr:flagellar assembly protein FliH [Azoarcus sp.]
MSDKPVTFARHQAVGAYRRWEPPNFDAPPPPLPEPEPPPEAAAPEPQAPPPEEAPAYHLPTVAEIEQMHEEARRAGYEEGEAEGREAGYADGRQSGYEEGRKLGYDEGRTAAADEARRLRELTTKLDEALTTLDAEVAEELMALAIELARKVLQHTLAVEPESVASVVRAALQSLPQARAQIFLNPADVALTNKLLGEILAQGGHLLVEDASVSPGGCRVEAGGAQIDATMETRWKRVLESLGRQHSPWLSTAPPAAPAAEKAKKPRASRAKKKADDEAAPAAEPAAPDALGDAPGDAP